MSKIPSQQADVDQVLYPPSPLFVRDSGQVGRETKEGRCMVIDYR
jgi:hypothetical protein